MAAVKVPQNLAELVKASFSAAKASGHLTFFPTQVALLSVGSITVRDLRLRSRQSQDVRG